MPRFTIEELMGADFLKNLADHPRDRAQELQPMLQMAGLTLEERYFVVGENKLIDIASGVRMLFKPSPWLHYRAE